VIEGRELALGLVEFVHPLDDVEALGVDLDQAAVLLRLLEEADHRVILDPERIE